MTDHIEQAEDECVHLIFPKSACSMCRESTQKFKERDLIVAQWLARYEGYCADCKSPIEIGDLICRMGDDRIVCSDCS